MFVDDNRARRKSTEPITSTNDSVVVRIDHVLSLCIIVHSILENVPIERFATYWENETSARC